MFVRISILCVCVNVALCCVGSGPVQDTTYTEGQNNNVPPPQQQDTVSSSASQSCSDNTLHDIMVQEMGAAPYETLAGRIVNRAKQQYGQAFASNCGHHDIPQPMGSINCKVISNGITCIAAVMNPGAGIQNGNLAGIQQGGIPPQGLSGGAPTDQGQGLPPPDQGFGAQGNPSLAAQPQGNPQVAAGTNMNAGGASAGVPGAAVGTNTNAGGAGVGVPGASAGVGANGQPNVNGGRK